MKKRTGVVRRSSVAGGAGHRGTRPVQDFEEGEVSRAILDAYHAKFARALTSDVVIVGAGPSGLVSAWRISRAGYRTVVLEKRLSPGGGIWGGSLGMNEVVVQAGASGVLREAGVSCRTRGRLCTVDALELASALCLQALRSGAIILNLMSAEDLCIHLGRTAGVVANRTLLCESLPIDPITFSARAVIDATGHEAVMASCLQKRGLLKSAGGRLPGEGPMDAPAGERFVVDHVTELYPGLWTTGMSVCASLGGPRMGPIFGGMLLSGERVAVSVERALGKPGLGGEGVPGKAS